MRLEPRVFVSGKKQPLSVYEGPFECQDKESSSDLVPLTINEKTYWSPDAAMVAAIKSTMAPEATPESLIEFRTKDGELLCALDYASQDREHGLGVVKAQWTPDAKYFVFSLTSSGGHRAWHAATQFYSRKTATIQTLDDYFDGEVSNPDFQLIAPSKVKTELWEGTSKPVTINLSSLATPANTKAFSIPCTGGRVSTPDQP